ncbi:MAG: hypothetical protein ACFE9Q_08190 [Candidatus Hodarchaeota archaeon]
MCIENIVDFQATYSILNLSLSTLIREILDKLKRGFIPILEIRIFLHALKSVPFADEPKGELLLHNLIDCVNNQWYLIKSVWTPAKIGEYVSKLQILILWDYKINRSLILYNDNEIKWEMDVSFILNKGEIEFFNGIYKKEVIA